VETVCGVKIRVWRQHGECTRTKVALENGTNGSRVLMSHYSRCLRHSWFCDISWRWDCARPQKLTQFCTVTAPKLTDRMYVITRPLK
jgi:hypothetical protein